MPLVVAVNVHAAAVVIGSNASQNASVSLVSGMLEGGVPVLKDGQCLGAVGVSGVKSSEDAQIARAGIAALQF